MDLLDPNSLTRIITYCDTTKALRSTSKDLCTAVAGLPQVTLKAVPAPFQETTNKLVASRGRYLERLTICNSYFTAADVIQLLKLCPSLDTLAITDLPKGCKGLDFSILFTDPAFAGVLSIAPSLRCLRVHNTLAFSLGSLTKCCPNLTSIEISNCLDFSDDDLELMEATLSNPSLQRLVLNNCPAIHDAGLHCVIKHGGSSLRHLDLRGCRGVTDGSLLHIHNVPKLQALYLNGCSSTTFATLKHVALSLSGLKHFGAASLDDDMARTLVKMTETSSDGPSVVSRFLGSLQTLELCLTFITDDALSLLAVHMPYIQTLAFWWCNGVTVRGLEACVSKCKRLTSLQVQHCRKVADRDAAVLRKANDHLVIRIAV